MPGDQSPGHGPGRASEPSDQSQSRAANVAETTAQKLARIRAAAQARSKKRKTFDESDSDSGLDAEPAPAKTKLKAASGGRVLVKIRPPQSMVKPNGSLAYCAACRKRFSVTPYTAYITKGPICHACGANAAEDASATAAVAAGKQKRPASAAARRKALLELKAETLPTLQELCINVLARHIEAVHDLAGVKADQKDQLAQAICRNRRLDNETVKLFLTPDVKVLKLYDCSDLSAHTLRTIPDFCPQLEEINLQLCGQIDGSVLAAWGDKLCARNLRSVELYGPFLVRQESWERFFAQAGTRLRSFKIRESARFNRACTEALAAQCTNLTQLGLAQIGPLDANALQPLHVFQNLTYLDISDPGVSAPGVPPKSLQDDEVLALLSHVGHQLRFLDLSGNADLTDCVLRAPGVKACENLTELNLAQLEKITAPGLLELFTDWPPPGRAHRGGLRKLHLTRIYSVDNATLQRVVAHSGATLEYLSVNSDDALTEQGLRELTPASVPHLSALDVSFVRDVGDEFLRDLMRSPALRQVNVFGCNRVVRILSLSNWCGCLRRFF